MTIFRNLLAGLLLALLGAGTAYGQAAPTPPSYSVLGGYLPVPAGTSSAAVQLPAAVTAFGAVTIKNAGSVSACFAMGTSAAVASTTPTGPNAGCLAAGDSVTIWVGFGNTYIAAITASGSSSLTVYQASGPVNFKTNGGGGGGGAPSGPAGGDLGGTYPNPTVLAVGNVSSGVLSASHGGAGSVTGALKADGAGNVSQAASTDLSDTALLARLASPALTGTPTAPTQGASDNSTHIATTAYVDRVGGVTSFNSRTGAVAPATNDYSFSQLSGSISASQTAALTGDVTKPAGSNATTLANIPAISGANLTNLNGSNIASGTVADARLSSNVPLKNGANVFTTMQVFNLNTAGAPTPITGTVVQIVGADAANGFVENDTFGATPIFTGRRADGTGASPTAVQSAEALAGFSARPYDGTGYTSASTGNVQAVASENFSGTNHGTDLVGNCTAITTTTTAECWRAKSSGFTIPTGSTYQINGTQIAASNLSNGVSGSGALCLVTNCAMTTPNLGTPSAAVLTNATSIPAGQLTGSIVNARLPSAMATTSLALGGATIGTDALGVTGTVTISGAVATGTLNATGNVIASSSLQAGSTSSIFIGSRGSASAAADGVWTLKNNAGAAFGRLQFGGTTSSFPAIKVNGTALNFRLADDSADAAITASAATLSGTLTASAGHVEAPRVVTAAGAVTMATTDYVVVVNKTAGAATTVNLPSSPTTGQHYYIKDGKGDAATNNITVTPAAGNIDGAGTLVMNVNYMAIELTYNGTQWNVI